MNDNVKVLIISSRAEENCLNNVGACKIAHYKYICAAFLTRVSPGTLFLCTCVCVCVEILISPLGLWERGLELQASGGTCRPGPGVPALPPLPPPLPARSCSPFSRSQDLWKCSRPALPTSPLKEGMDLNPTNELQKNYGFLPMPFPAPQALRLGGGGDTHAHDPRSAE